MATTTTVQGLGMVNYLTRVSVIGVSGGLGEGGIFEKLENLKSCTQSYSLHLILAGAPWHACGRKRLSKL